MKKTIGTEERKLLTAELLKKALETVKPDSRKRRSMAMAYSSLLNYFNIAHDLRRYRGNYKPKEKREIPKIAMFFLVVFESLTHNVMSQTLS